MSLSKRWTTGLLALTMLAGACFGEEPQPPAKFYKLDFVVKEVEGSKILNSRTYMTMVSTGGLASVRAGSKIPYAAGPANIQQIDVGVNIDLRGIKELQDHLAFLIKAEISSVVDRGNVEMHPTVRQNVWQSDVVVPLKKPTLLFASENLDAKTQMQVEVTATPIP